MSSPPPRQQSHEAKRQCYFSLLFILISLIFWIWAIINTTQSSSGGFDAGVISFLLVLITHSILLIRQWQRNGIPSTTSKCPPYTIVGTHLLVTLNYLVGIYAALATDLISDERRTGFAVYCAMAAILWFLSAIVGWRIFNSRQWGYIHTLSWYVVLYNNKKWAGVCVCRKRFISRAIKAKIQSSHEWPTLTLLYTIHTA